MSRNKITDEALDIFYAHRRGSPYAPENDEPELEDHTHQEGDTIVMVQGYGLDFSIYEVIELRKSINVYSYAKEFQQKVTDRWSVETPDGMTFGKFLERKALAHVVDYKVLNIDPHTTGFNAADIEEFAADKGEAA